MNNNPMSANDYEAIKWLNEKVLDENSGLRDAWMILKAYYDECLEELKNIDTSESPFSDSIEKDTCTDKVIDDYITNEEFMREFKEVFKYSDEKINDAVTELSNSETPNKLENEWLIAKIYRFYNMHLKLGHSARITYIAENNLNKMIENLEEVEESDMIDNISLLKRTILLSALLHDVGRFYQSVHYNSLVDNVMKKHEDKIVIEKRKKTIPGIETPNDYDEVEELVVDHAIAGYYYSIASALELHNIGINEGINEEMIRFITEAIASTVVRNHQKNNSDMPHFEYSTDSMALIRDDNSLFTDLVDFINSAYEKANLMDCKVDFIDEKHKKFIDEFISKIRNLVPELSHDKEDEAFYEITDDSLYEEIRKSWSNSINEVLHKVRGQKNVDMESLSEEIITKLLGENILEEKEELKDLIIELLEKFLDYDIAVSIEDLFKDKKMDSEISPAIRCLISSAMTMTMDADKIDILNQRALGLYNTEYVLDGIKVFPLPDESLISILNNRFEFRLDPDSFTINEDIINIINKMSLKVRTGLKNYLSEFDIFNKENEIDNSISSISVDNNKVIIKKDTGEEISYETDKFFNLFNEEWIDFNIKHTNIESLDNFKDFKKKYAGDLQIFVKRDVIDRNIENNCKSMNLSEEEIEKKKTEVIKDLLISDSLNKRFKFNSDNKPGLTWILASDNKDADHIINSSVSGLIWQLNQFVLCNLRNVHSYEFIDNYKILDDIMAQYTEKDPIIAAILKEYIDYTKKFIDKIINNNSRREMLTEEDVRKVREELYQESIDNSLNIDVNKK